jgi:hypothetical protein
MGNMLALSLTMLTKLGHGNRIDTLFVTPRMGDRLRGDPATVKASMQ